MVLQAMANAVSRTSSAFRSKNRIAEALTRRGQNCKIHPTATVEAAYSVTMSRWDRMLLLGSFVGNGVIIQEHSQVHLSILNDGAVVGRSAMVRMCLLMKRAMVSKCFGIQASVVAVTHS